MLEHIHT